MVNSCQINSCELCLVTKNAWFLKRFGTLWWHQTTIFTIFVEYPLAFEHTRVYWLEPSSGGNIDKHLWLWHYPTSTLQVEPWAMSILLFSLAKCVNSCGLYSSWKTGDGKVTLSIQEVVVLADFVIEDSIWNVRWISFSSFKHRVAY